MKKLLWLLLTLPAAAFAQDETFDFTGTIITSTSAAASTPYSNEAPTGAFAGDSGAVAGTFTFDFAYQNPLLSSGPTSTSTQWYAENVTGNNPYLVQNTPTSQQTAPGMVFSTTLVGNSATDVGLAYITAPPSSYESISGIQDYGNILTQPNSFNPGLQYIAQENNTYAPLPGATYGNLSQSAFLIYQQGSYPPAGVCCSNPPLGFSADGLPVSFSSPSSSLTAVGFIGYAVNGVANGLYFIIDSLTPEPTESAVAAPEIDPAGATGALTLLAGLVAVARKRRRL